MTRQNKIHKEICENEQFRKAIKRNFDRVFPIGRLRKRSRKYYKALHKTTVAIVMGRENKWQD